MNKIPYIRVATTYYKEIYEPPLHAPTDEEEYEAKLIAWNIETIRQDLSRDEINQIKKYDGFVCIPDHLNYQSEYGKFYNIYHKLSTKLEKGKIETTMMYLDHIFGNQLQNGLDYLQLLYTKPTQILPILCLVSQTRGTGKTTMLYWLKKVFENNMTYMDNNSISSQFNSDLSGKLIIGIEEARFKNDALIDWLKNLSTANRFKSEAKGKDRVETDFFGKFILCSNNETNLIKVDEEEIRFWVIKVPVIKKDNLDVHIYEKLKDEIPAFLYFLKNRELATSKALTRMWFTPKQIETSALKKMIQYNKNPFEIELATILYSAMEDLELDKIDLCPNDALNILNRSRLKIGMSEIRGLLKQVWKLENQPNSLCYKQLYVTDLGYNLVDAKGRYFTISKDFLLSNFDELMN